MPNYARDFTELCARIAESERRVEVQHEKLARWQEGSDEARYAGALLKVLSRSLEMMYGRRERLERDLRLQVRAARQQQALRDQHRSVRTLDRHSAAL